MMWSIYHASREYARVMGDPKIGEVEAATKDEAERIACEAGIARGAGAWAVPGAPHGGGNDG